MEYKLINTTNLSEARRMIELNTGNKIAVVAKDDEFNRKILESDKVDLLIFGKFGDKNSFRQADSGMDSVLFKLANKNNIVIGFDFKVFSEKEFKLASNIAKIIQNIDLAKKCKVKIIFVNYNGNRKDLFSLLLSLGMSTDNAKYACENSIEKIY